MDESFTLKSGPPCEVASEVQAIVVSKHIDGKDTQCRSLSVCLAVNEAILLRVGAISTWVAALTIKKHTIQTGGVFKRAAGLVIALM